MKLVKCKNCNDVVRLIHDKWRKCDCGKSGGQYNDDLLSATVGGDCEVIGLRNDFFETKPFSKKRGDLSGIIQGEYKGDVQIHRIKLPDGPKLKMEFEKIDDETVEITFTDDREYTINMKGKNKSPKSVKLPANDSPSFKNKKARNESKILDSYKNLIIEELIKLRYF